MQKKSVNSNASQGGGSGADHSRNEYSEIFTLLREEIEIFQKEVGSSQLKGEKRKTYNLPQYTQVSTTQIWWLNFLVASFDLRILSEQLEGLLIYSGQNLKMVEKENLRHLANILDMIGMDKKYGYHPNGKNCPFPEEYRFLHLITVLTEAF